MTDFLEEKKREINARLKELRPLVDEYHRLEAAAAALDGVGGTAAPARAASAAASPARARGDSAERAAGTGRRGRPRGSGTRSKQALELVRTRPGITIPEIAEAMGIKQNYLYRVLPALAEGRPGPQGGPRLAPARGGVAAARRSRRRREPHATGRTSHQADFTASRSSSSSPTVVSILRLREVADLEALDDLVVAARAAHREART